MVIKRKEIVSNGKTNASVPSTHEEGKKRTLIKLSEIEMEKFTFDVDYWVEGEGNYGKWVMLMNEKECIGLSEGTYAYKQWQMVKGPIEGYKVRLFFRSFETNKGKGWAIEHVKKMGEQDMPSLKLPSIE